MSTKEYWTAIVIGYDGKSYTSYSVDLYTKFRPSISDNEDKKLFLDLWDQAAEEVKKDDKRLIDMEAGIDNAPDAYFKFTRLKGWIE